VIVADGFVGVGGHLEEELVTEARVGRVLGNGEHEEVAEFVDASEDGLKRNAIQSGCYVTRLHSTLK
jgi:hypothetical protein